jgi:hypothetical protein
MTFTPTLDLTQVGDTFQATLRLTNRTPGETMTGTFTVYADAANGDRTAIPGASWTLSLGPDAPSDPLTFTVPGTTSPGPWLVVFRGTLGPEAGAVAVGRAGREVLGFLSYDRYEYNGTTLRETEYPLYEVPPTSWQASFPDPPLGAWDTVSRGAGYEPDLARTPWFNAAETLSRYVLLRDPVSTASRMVVTVSVPYSLCYEYDRLIYFHHLYRYLTTETYTVLDPPVAEIVELPAPPDLATFYGYTYRTLPEPVRTLLTVSGTDSAPWTVDVSGVAFVGIRLLTVPEDPGQLPSPPLPEGNPVHTLSRTCQLITTVRFEAPPP